MIKSLLLVNFRRHAELELRFDEDRQLVLIAGNNGVGKTTILEAIQYALWGESRHGRRGLHALVRRGAELEGMSVEMTFTIGDDEYRVHRRRDGKASTAVLYVNESPLAEGPNAVTEEITALMGMDSAGFRLAVIAQQKDLDGLASLRPAERAQMITRLLRLDAVTSARNEASAVFRRERELALALRGPDSVELAAGIQQAVDDVEAASAELKRAQESMVLLDAELAATADVEAAWQEAMQTVARLDGAVNELTSRLVRQRSELDNVTVPEAAASTPLDIASASEQLADIERRITQAENVNKLHTQWQSVTAEIEGARERLAELSRELQQPEPDVESLTASLLSSEALVALKDADVQNALAALGRAEGEVVAARARLAKADAQGEVCGECGQAISHEHKAAQHAEAFADVERTTEALESARARVQEARDAAEILKGAVAETRSALQAGQAAVATRHRHQEALLELERRIRTYEGQLERLPSATVAVDDLYEQKATLLATIASAQEFADRERARMSALTRREALRDAIAELEAQLRARTAERDGAKPSADLKGRYDARQVSVNALKEEQEIARHWKTQLAVAHERLAAATRRQAEAEKTLHEQAGHQQMAVNAAAAKRLLEDVSERMATQIRPSLEGAISALLSTMSEGRFASVKVSADYDILVEDDGAYRPLTELSGGEVDLIALATRLALAQVVSDRHGAGGAGFLVLDECFGSQDPQRRASILGALRNLRETYSQIFLISHVENIEDSADLVVTVRAGENREETEVVAS